eukprot:238330-Hanusia_phi.AAC.1
MGLEGKIGREVAVVKKAAAQLESQGESKDPCACRRPAEGAAALLPRARQDQQRLDQEGGGGRGREEENVSAPPSPPASEHDLSDLPTCGEV